MIQSSEIPEICDSLHLALDVVVRESLVDVIEEHLDTVARRIRMSVRLVVVLNFAVNTRKSQSFS